MIQQSGCAINILGKDNNFGESDRVTSFGSDDDRLNFIVIEHITKKLSILQRVAGTHRDSGILQHRIAINCVRRLWVGRGAEERVICVTRFTRRTRRSIGTIPQSSCFQYWAQHVLCYRGQIIKVVA